MADVEIKYGSTTITIDVSGTEVLETNGATMEDNVIVTYVKPSTKVTSSEAKGTWFYVDPYGKTHTYYASGQLPFDTEVIKHSLIVVRTASTSEKITTPVGSTLVYKRETSLDSYNIYIFQAD